MNSNKCNNEICAATRYYVDDGDKFNSLEKELRKVSGSLFSLEQTVKELKEKVNLLVKKNEKLV